MKQRTGCFTWVAGKHGRHAHAARGAVGWQPGAVVTALCGAEIRPSPWPFVLPGPCPACERAICEQEIR